MENKVKQYGEELDTGKITVSEALPIAFRQGSWMMNNAIWRRLFLFAGGVVLLGAIIVGVGAIISTSKNSQRQGDAQLALPALEGGNAQDENYSLYGKLKVSSSIILAPSATSDMHTAGELFFSQEDRRLKYYDGSQYILLGEPNQATSQEGIATTLNGVGGAITLGNNLVLQNGVLSAVTPQPISGNQGTASVTSVQGRTGDVSFTAGRGITISGTTIISTAVQSLRSGSSDLTISDDGNGNLTISIAGSGEGGGVALAPVEAQGDSSNNPSIFIHKTGSGNLLQFATGLTPVDRFVVNNNGAITSGTISFAQVTNKPLFVNTINGLSGDVLLGEGFDTINNTIVNTGVLSVATVTGHLSLGTGLEISGRTIYNTGVIKLFGTTNQIAASAETGEITLSLPQNIASTSSPTFAGLTLASPLSVSNGGTGTAALTLNGVLIGNGTAAVTTATTVTGGQCLMSTAGVPAFGTCPGSGAVQSLNGAGGTLTLSGTSVGSVTTVGTAITIGDATSAIKGLAAFNATNLTVSSGTVNTIQNIRTVDSPTFAGLTLTNALGIANGGTGLNTTPLNGQLLIGNGSGYSLATLTAGLGIQITNGAGGITIAAPFAGTCDQCANDSLSNLSSVAINTSLLPGTAGAIDIGSGTLPVRDLFIAGSSISPGLNNFRLTGAATAARTITLPDLSGAMAIVQGASPVAQTGNISVSGALNSGSLSVSGSGSVGGTLTAGAASVTGNATVGGEVRTNTIAPNGANPLTIGISSQDLVLQGSSTTISATNGLNKVSLTFVPPTANITYRLQNAAAGTYDICTTAGNCTGVGGAVDSPGGTAGALAKFSDANTLVNSLLSESGTTVSVGGTLAVNTITNTVAGITNTLQFATPGVSNKTITLPNLSGTVCLDTNNCNFVALQGDTSTAQSGRIHITGPVLAGSFNNLALTAQSNGFTISGGTTTRTLTVSGDSFIDQDLRVSATPTFAGISLTAPLSVSSGGTGLSAAAANGQLLIGNGTGYTLGTLTAGAGVQITNGAGSITIAVPNSGACNTCATTALSNLASVAINTSLLPAAATNVDIGSSTLGFQNGYFANTLYTRYVSPNGATPLTVGVVEQDLTLQGAATKLTSTSGTQTATLTFEAPTANYTYRLTNAGTTGIYDICTSAGNCSGTGGNYIQNTTTMQTANFTIQSAAATNVGGIIRGAASQTADLLQLQNSAGVTLVGVTADGKLAFGNGTNTASFQRGTLTANRTYTLPDADGTLCLTSGNCAGAGGGITGSGTANNLAKFTGSSTLGNSLLFDNGTNVGIGIASTAAKLSVNEKLRLFDLTPTGAAASTDAGYLFGATIPSGMFTEVSGEVLSYGINVPQVGTRDNARVGGLFRLDTRGTNQEFAVNGFPTGGSVAANRLAVNLQNGNASVAVNGGNFGVGIASAGYKLDVSAGTGIVAQFSGRVIGGNAVNTNEFTTLSQLNAATANNSSYFIQGGNSFSAAATLGTNDANALNLETSNATRMTILAGGNVGIGNANPGSLLDVSGALTVRAIAVPALSVAGQGRIYFDSTTNKFRVSESGGSFVDLIGTATATTLQAAYTASTGGTTPEIKLDSTRGGLDIQDADTSIGSQLLTVRKSNAAGQGNIAFAVGPQGNITANSDATTGTAATITANALTTGSGLNVSSTSNNLTAGNLISGSHAATYTNQLDVNNNLLNISRSLTANITAGGITLDSVSTVQPGNTRPYSWSHTVGTGADRVLVVGVSIDCGSNFCPSTTNSSTATYGGVPMNLVRVDAYRSTRTEIWVLANPSTGTANVEVNASFISYARSGAVSWFGVNQTTPVRHSNGISGGPGYMSTTVNSQVNDIALGVFATDTTNGPTPDAGQIQLWSGWDMPNNPTMYGHADYKPGQASTTTLGYTGSDKAITAISLMPAGAADSMSISGALANLSSNCSVIAGGCTDTSSILNLNQQYAAATGTVLSIQNAGTGNLAVFDATNAGANGVSVDVQSNSASQYALRVTANNGAINALYVRADGNVGIGNINPGSLLDLSGALTVRSMAAPSASSVGQGRIYFDSTTNKFRVSENGGSFVDLIGSATATTLQAAYTTSAGGTTPEIKLDSTRGGLDIQDADTTIGANLLTVRKSNASGLGSIAFGVNNNGNITANSDATTGTAATITANALTTGSGLNVSSNSSGITGGSIIQGSHSTTYTSLTNNNANILNLSRSLTSNITSGGVTFDTQSSRGAGFLNSYSFNHTVGTGSNRILLVGLSNDCSNYTCGPATVTYGGVAMTRVQQAIANTAQTELWMMVNPPSGTASVSVSYATGNGHKVAGATSWFGVDQTTPYRAVTNSGATSGTTASITVASEINDIVFAAYTTGSLTAPTEGAGQTTHWAWFDEPSPNQDMVGAGGSKAGATTSTTLTFATSGIWSMAGLSLRPAALTDALTVTGAIANLSSNCSVTAGGCNDSANVLNLNQQYASATGAVLNVLNAGTGNLAVFDATNAGANGVSIDVQSNNSSQYALRVTTNNGANNALYVRADGNVGIGNAAPNEKLHVSGNVRAQSFITDATADIAEDYPAGEALNPGDVVRFGSDGKLYKATVTNGSLAGVISTDPGLRLAGGTDGAPLALAGRVPVAVSNENGAVAAGDYLTASSRPGVAMKATGKGMVIGVALEALNGSEGTVMLFVNLHYYDPTSGTAMQGSDGTFTSLNVSGASTLASLTVTGNTVVKGNLTVEGHFIGNADTRGEVTVVAGQTMIEYKFVKQYVSKPHVVVSPVNAFAPSYRVEATVDGFKLYLKEAAPENLTFNYQVQQ